MATRSHNLSKRENEVVELLLQGKSNKQIAATLGISASTVEFHLKNVYAKLELHSRTEVILKLGKSTGVIDREPQESIVAVRRMKDNNRENFSFTELEMRKRIFYYVLTGLIFGIAYWYYFNAVADFTKNLNIDEENGFIIWLSMSILFVVDFGVWLVPAIVPAIYEFRYSQVKSLAVLAVIVVTVSAVLGYYVSFIVVLALIGAPQMEFLLVLGKHSPTFWQDWVDIFRTLILSDLLKWAFRWMIVGGFSGFVTSSIYSFWLKKPRDLLPG
jgi:DNA-binding CsgD family transcriptional regulator